MSKERTQSEISLAPQSAKDLESPVDQIRRDTVPRIVPDLNLETLETKLKNPKELAIDVDAVADLIDQDLDSPISFDSSDVPPEWLDGKDKDILPTTIPAKVEQSNGEDTQLERNVNATVESGAESKSVVQESLVVVEAPNEPSLNNDTTPVSQESPEQPKAKVDVQEKTPEQSISETNVLASQEKLLSVSEVNSEAMVSESIASQLASSTPMSIELPPVEILMPSNALLASPGEFPPVIPFELLEPFPTSKPIEKNNPRKDSGTTDSLKPQDTDGSSRKDSDIVSSIVSEPFSRPDSMITPGSRPDSLVSTPGKYEPRPSNLRGSIKGTETPRTNSLAPSSDIQLVAGMSLYVIRPHKAQDLDELDLELGDVVELDITPAANDEFWLKGTMRTWGKRNGQQGFFPRENVTVQDENGELPAIELPAEEEQKGDEAEEEPPEVQPVPKGTTVIALFPFEPSKQDELSLVQGQTIVVMECPEGGWWKGVTGIEDKKPVTGWFPATLVKAKEDATSKVKNDHLRATSTPTSSTSSIDRDSSHGDKKVNWFKKLRSVNDNILEQESDRRKRAVSAPGSSLSPSKLSSYTDQNGTLLEVSTELLNNSRDSISLAIEPFPSSSRRASTSSRQEVLYDIKPVGEENSKARTRATRTASIAIGKGGSLIDSVLSGVESKPRSRAESVYNPRATIVIPNSLSPSDVIHGATNETVQDKVGPAVYKLLSDQEKKRLACIWELIQTERDYCRDLSIIIENFMKPMSNMNSVGQKNMQVLFANVEQIFTVNMDFLFLLQQVEDLRNINAISEVFLIMGERFMCYIPYCSNQQTSSTKFLKSILSKGEIKSFLEDTYKNPVCRQLDLPAFLLKPVQRICKYPLLIKEMIKNTPKEHSDLVNLNRAMERMQNAVATVNECARKLGGMKPVTEVQNRFAEKISIANSNRFLVREDTIQVMFSDGRKNRKLFLFNDLLILARRDWRDKHHVIEKSSLKDIRVSDIAESGGNGSTTTLMEIEVVPNSEFDAPNRYIVSSLSVADKLTWLDAYKSLVRYNVKSKNINDITMTSSSADGAGDDDDEKPRESATVEEETVRARKATENAQLEEKTKQLTSKIELLEKIIAEKEGSIKEWEAKILKLDTEHTAKIKALQEENDTRSKLLEDSNKKVKALELTIDELNQKHSAYSAESEKVQNEQKLQIDEWAKRAKSMEIELSLLKATCTEQDANNADLKEQIDASQAKLIEKEKMAKKLNQELEDSKAQIEEMELHFTKRIKEKDSIIAKAEHQLHTMTDEQTVVSNRIQDLCSFLGVTLKRGRFSRLDDKHSFVDPSDLHRTGRSTLNINQSSTQLSRSSLYSNDRNDVPLLDLIKHAADDLLKQNAEKLSIIQDRNLTINNLTEQLTQVKRQLSDKENNITDTSMQKSFLQKRVADLETSIANNETLIAQLKKELLLNETLLEEQRTFLKKTVTEKENQIIELKSHLKQESDTVRTLNTTIKGLETELSAKEVCIKDSVLNNQQLNLKISSLNTELSESNQAWKQLNEKYVAQNSTLDEIQLALTKAHTETIVEFQSQGGVVAQLKSFVTEANSMILELRHRRSELDQTSTNLKSSLTAAQEQVAANTLLISSLQQKVQQKETRTNDLEATIKDLRFKCQDLESNLSALQNKLIMKDSKYSEVEALTTNQISNITQLKQKITEQEMLVMNLQSKLLESENKGQRQENALTAANSTISSLEQRIVEFKLQVEGQADIVKRLDREKRDLISQIEETQHSYGIATKELRQYKEQSQQLSIELTRVQQTLSTTIRDSERDLQSLEEKHRLQLSKEVAERDSEITLLRTEMQNVKQNQISETNRLKSDHENVLRAMSKSQQDEIKAIQKTLEEKVEETRYLQLKHKDEIAHLTMDLKQTHQVEMQQLKSKNEAAVEILKANVGELTQKVNELERDIDQSQEQLKQKELECIRAQMEGQKFDEEIKRIKSQLIIAEEAHYSKLKQYERELKIREESITRTKEETDIITKRNDEMQGSLVTLQEQLAAERDFVESLKKRIEELSLNMKEQESKHFSVITDLKTKLQDSDKNNHESILLIERFKASDESSKQIISKLSSDLETVTSKYEKQIAQIQNLMQEKQALGFQIQHSQEQLDRKAQELLANMNSIGELNDQLKQKETQIQDTTLKNDRSEAQLSQLQHNIVVYHQDLEEARQALKRQQEEERETNKKMTKDYKKKHTQEIENLQQKLESQNFDFVSLKSKHDQLVKDFGEQSSSLHQLESQMLALQRLLSKETKCMASMQLTLLELASMVNITLPWNMNDIMTLPDKLKATFKSGKIRAPFENVDPNVLLEIVSIIRQQLITKEKLYEELVAATQRCNELESMQNELQVQLSDASNALSIVEERINHQEVSHSQEREVYKKKLVQMEKALEKALAEVKKGDQKTSSLTDELTAVQQEKLGLERDFMELYERLQATKQAFLEKTKTISSDTAMLLDQYNESKRIIQQRDDDIANLNATLANLEKEHRIQTIQKERTEKLLKEATDTSKHIATQLNNLKADKERLKYEKEELQKQLNSILESKDREIESLLNENDRAEQKIMALGQSMNSTSKILDEFKEKWSKSIQREKELESRNQFLMADISTLKSQLHAMQENEAIGTSDELLSLQAQITELERSYARIKKDKILLEQEVILLRTKNHRKSTKLPDPKIAYTIPHPNDLLLE